MNAGPGGGGGRVICFEGCYFESWAGFLNNVFLATLTATYSKSFCFSKKPIGFLKLSWPRFMLKFLGLYVLNWRPAGPERGVIYSGGHFCYEVDVI